MVERSYCWLILRDWGRAVHNVVHGSQGDWVIKEILQQFDHPAIGTMADQYQSQNQLPQPGLGDRQIKQNVIAWCGRLEGLLEGLLCRVHLVIDELPADLELSSQSRDGCNAGEHLDG